MKVLQSPQRIADDLRNNLLAEQDKFYFFLITILVNGIYGTRSLISEFNIYTLIDYALTIGGSWWCFQANSHGDNRRFFDRFICLQTAMAIRVYAVIYILYYLLGAIWSMLARVIFFPQMTILSFLLWNGFWIGGNCYIYIRTRNLISYVARPDPT